MTRDRAQPFTIGFVGHTTAELAGRAAEYEDAVLPLLADHGARVVYRGRRAQGQDEALPFEMHLLWFPSQDAYDAYLGDPGRSEVLERFGDVFTSKQAVELDEING
jgi:uncharacterized protein (DUF1330 family)